MKIALVNKVFSQAGGGAERYAADLATELVHAGHEVHAFGVTLEDLPSEAIKHPLPKPPKPGFRKILRFSKDAAKAVGQDQYDVVYALTQMFPADMYFMGGGMHQHWLTIRYPAKWFCILRYLTNPTNIAQWWIEKQLCKKANCKLILANSHMIKKHAMQYGSAAEDQVAVVHNGVDRARFNPEVSVHRDTMREQLGLADKQLGLLFLSHNWGRKGLSTIILALAQMGEAGKRYKLIIAGKGKQAMFEQLAKLKGVEDQLQFIGSTQEPEKLYAAGDVFVLPTLYDPCAGVTVEALACGLPVISSTGNGASELIQEGETGFVIEPTDASQLAAHLSTLLDDAKRSDMGEAAAKSMEEQTFTRVAEQTIQLMEQIAQ